MWYAVQVVTGQEESTKELIINNLDTIHDCFVIRFVRSRRYLGKWHDEGRVMFPGYVFVETDDPEGTYKELNNIARLTKLLGREKDLYIPISREEELSLTKLTGKEHILDMSQGYIEGDRVHITAGPLKGNEGLIKKIDRHKREAVISLMMFGRETDTKVGLEIVMKV